ncbi:MAG: hypothetical protein J5533_02065 [Bacteroidales bacterium]|nr:hypothetical protein [Bacteroidales bacterium]
MKTEQSEKRLRYKVPDISGLEWLPLTVLAASDLETIVDDGEDIPWT